MLSPISVDNGMFRNIDKKAFKALMISKEDLRYLTSRQTLKHVL